MGQVLHGSATTTEAIRRAIQHSQASLRALAQRHGINPKTVAKWKKRGSVADLPTGPKDAKSTVLSVEEEAIISPRWSVSPATSRLALSTGAAVAPIIPPAPANAFPTF